MSSNNDTNNSFSDPKQGGDLSDMAVTGTKVPNDAGDYEVLPSVPRPGQGEDQELGNRALHEAADNAADMPRSVKDTSGGADIVTGTGDTLPAHVDQKRMHEAPGGIPSNPAAKGHPRDDKASKQKGGDQDLGAADQAEAES